MSQRIFLFLAGLIFVCTVNSATAEDRSLRENPALEAWFESEVEKIEADSDLMRYGSLAQWAAARPTLRNELFDMLGLDPRPERTPLQAVTNCMTTSRKRIQCRSRARLPHWVVVLRSAMASSPDGPMGIV